MFGKSVAFSQWNTQPHVNTITGSLIHEAIIIAMVDNGASNSGGPSTSAIHMPGTELGHIGSVVREERLNLTISLPLVKETDISLSPALNSNPSFI
jgi:hypothetical protein